MKKKAKPLPLFEPGRAARFDDPDTSQDAAESMVDHVNSQHRRILDCLSNGAPWGLTAEQIADRSGGHLDKVQVGRRLCELEEVGLVVKTEFKHRNRSRREAYKYRLPREERLEV